MLRQGAGATCNGLGECLDPVPVQPALAEGLQWLTPFTAAVPGFPATMLSSATAGCCSGLPLWDGWCLGLAVSFSYSST